MKKEKRIAVRLSDYEYNLLEHMAKEVNKTKSDFIRECVLEQKIFNEHIYHKLNVIDRGILERYLVTLSRIGNNLNQIARQMNSFNDANSREVLRYAKDLRDINEHVETILLKFKK